jgi:hypothetical protein
VQARTLYPGKSVRSVLVAADPGATLLQPGAARQCPGHIPPIKKEVDMLLAKFLNVPVSLGV